MDSDFRRNDKNFPRDQHLFYLHRQNSSLSPELADAIRQAGKKQNDKVIDRRSGIHSLQQA
jgi:hypothetical protein